MRIYKILLRFSVPNEKGILLDFRTRYQDVVYGIFAFNKQFKGKKVIKLLGVYENSIAILMKIDRSEEVTAREITYFSKRLHHDRNWKEFTRNDTKLFTATQFDDVTNEFINDFDSIKEMSNPSIEQITDLSSTEKNYVNLSDDDAINALKALINLQDIGSQEIKGKRKEILVKIKSLLIQAIE